MMPSSRSFLVAGLLVTTFQTAFANPAVDQYLRDNTPDGVACWEQDDRTFECVSADLRRPVEVGDDIDALTVLSTCHTDSLDYLVASDCHEIDPDPPVSPYDCKGMDQCLDLLAKGKCKEIVFFPNGSGSGTVYGYCVR